MGNSKRVQVRKSKAFAEIDKLSLTEYEFNCLDVLIDAHKDSDLGNVLEKISKALRGVPFDPNHAENLSKIVTGEKNK